MINKSSSTLQTIAITANLAALHVILAKAAERTAEAHAHILRGERNGAIGTVIDLDRTLDEAKALFLAAIALHRTANL